MSQHDPWDFSEFAGEASTQQRGGRPNDPSGLPAPVPSGVAQPSPSPGSDHPGRPHPFAPTASASAVGVPAFGAAAEPAPTLVTASAPVQWLALAAGLAVVGLILALLLGGMPPVAITAWALCGPLALGTVAYFMTADLRARTGAVYLARAWVRVAYVVALVLCLAGAMVSAWRIADWVGRL